METQPQTTSDLQQRSRAETRGAESEIRKVLEDLNDAFRAGDLNLLMSYYLKDVVAFDMPTPLLFKGVDSYRKTWQMGLDMTKEFGPFETAEDRYIISGDVGVFHCLLHMSGTLKKNDEKIDTWVRYTGVFRKVDGKWLIAHEHLSVPIEMETEKPAFDLKPESPSVWQ